MTKKIAQLGFFLTFALILAYVESLIPFTVGIPGIKLGLPNLTVVFMLSTDRRFKDGEAFGVNMMRIVLSGFLFGSLYSILYAFAGAVCSFLAMKAGRRCGRFSVIGISVLGGVFHNIGQLIVAIFVTQTVYLGYDLPFLIAAGTITGALLGLVVRELMPYYMRIEAKNR